MHLSKMNRGSYKICPETALLAFYCREYIFSSSSFKKPVSHQYLTDCKIAHFVGIKLMSLM